MNGKILRVDAIDLLCKKNLNSLSKDDKASLLLSWWSIDESNPEFLHLTEPLKQEMKETDMPGDLQSTLYEPLLLVALKHTFRGVHNEYLSSRLKEEALGDFIVEGELEKLLECPCCHYLTLESRGEYDICPVCFWEDTGDSNPEHYSSPNRMSLGEARDNFLQFGAISLRAKAFADPDGIEKWIRVVG